MNDTVVQYISGSTDHVMMLESNSGTASFTGTNNYVGTLTGTLQYHFDTGDYSGTAAFKGTINGIGTFTGTLSGKFSGFFREDSYYYLYEGNTYEDGTLTGTFAGTGTFSGTQIPTSSMYIATQTMARTVGGATWSSSTT